MSVSRFAWIAQLLGTMGLVLGACADDSGTVAGTDSAMTGASSADSGGGAGSTGEANDGPCDANEIRVWGMLDGEPIDLVTEAEGHSIFFDDTSVDGVDFNVSFESEDGWTYGGTEAMRVLVGFPTGGRTDLGNCLDDGFPGTRTVDEDGQGAVFSVGMIREAEVTDVFDLFGNFCEAPVLEGQLEGCFRWPPS